MCQTCENANGTPNTDLLDAEGTCIFGCNRHIDVDHGFCPECKDHSTNSFECPNCGQQWEQEYGNHKWEKAKWYQKW